MRTTIIIAFFIHVLLKRTSACYCGQRAPTCSQACNPQGYDEHSFPFMEESMQFQINLQATKLFIVTSATKGGGGGYNPLRFSVRFKILYRVIQPLIQHCLLRKMVYLNII